MGRRRKSSRRPGPLLGPARFDPRPGETFDPAAFFATKGTLYLLAEADGTASRLLQSLVADITRTAKDLADHSLRSRLNPPLTLVLDEIANWVPLPVLPTYVSAYGGSGAVTIAVIQSRAQMARRGATPSVRGTASGSRRRPSRSGAAGHQLQHQAGQDQSELSGVPVRWILFESAQVNGGWAGR